MVWGGWVEKRVVRVLVMDVRRVWMCAPGVGTVEVGGGGGGAFSLSVEEGEERVFWVVDGSFSFLGGGGGEEGIWEEEGCGERGAGRGKSSFTIWSLLDLEFIWKWRIYLLQSWYQAREKSRPEVTLRCQIGSKEVGRGYETY